MVITRFAPSPTGYLHIGGLRTALFSYLWAKKNNGKFLLRIEDTDLSRNSEEAKEKIIEAFKWVGLDFDGEVIYQSKRFDIYNRYIQQLLDSGNAYKCYMSKEELTEIRAEQEAKKERPRYNGKYRNFTGTPPENIKPVIRIKASQDGEIKFVDGIKGEVVFKATEVDDFIIARSDGTPTYNFVVAIDDAEMGLTEIIRGDDHLSNTPKQIVVYNALNLEIPKFYHVPMILNEKGKKLSKRDGATDVMEYKNLGYTPEVLLNFLVRLGWSNGDQEIFSIEEMLNLFNPKNINKSASAYNTQKLDWLSGEYLKITSNEKLIELLKFHNLDLENYSKANLLLDAIKPKAKTLIDLVNSANDILKEPIEFNNKAVKKFMKPANIENLKEFLEIIKSDETENYEDLFNNFLVKKEIGMPQLAQPIRICLLGKTQSPSIFDLMAIVGKDEMIRRVEKYLNNI